MKIATATIAILGASALTVGCSAQSKISGSYVVCGTKDGAMLQADMQATGGQITGVLSIVQLPTGSGKVKGDTSSITGGTLDGSQLTLTLHPGIFGTNISGTREGNTIRLQDVDRSGKVSTSVLIRGSVDGFSRCSNQLQQTAATIALNAELEDQTQHFIRTVHDAEAWLLNAQLHESRIPLTEAHYREIQEEMQKLVEKERRTRDQYDRSSLSFDVRGKGYDGHGFDTDVNSLWDWDILGHVDGLTKRLTKDAELCQLKNSGADPSTRERWETACRDASAERSKFDSVSKEILEQRSRLEGVSASGQAPGKLRSSRRIG